MSLEERKILHERSRHSNEITWSILNDKNFTSNTFYVLDVKCLSFNVELQHIGMSSIKLHGNESQRYRFRCCVEHKTINSYLTASFHKRREFRRISHGRLAYPKEFSATKTVKIFIQNPRTF